MHTPTSTPSRAPGFDQALPASSRAPRAPWTASRADRWQSMAQTAAARMPAARGQRARRAWWGAGIRLPSLRRRRIAHAGDSARHGSDAARGGGHARGPTPTRPANAACPPPPRAPPTLLPRTRLRQQPAHPRPVDGDQLDAVQQARAAPPHGIDNERCQQQPERPRHVQRRVRLGFRLRRSRRGREGVTASGVTPRQARPPAPPSVQPRDPRAPAPQPRRPDHAQTRLHNPVHRAPNPPQHTSAVVRRSSSRSMATSLRSAFAHWTNVCGVLSWGISCRRALACVLSACCWAEVSVTCWGGGGGGLRGQREVCASACDPVGQACLPVSGAPPRSRWGPHEPSRTGPGHACSPDTTAKVHPGLPSEAQSEI